MNNPILPNLKGYVLEAEIGEGGFGKIYRARQSTVERDVAIKVIQPQFANQPDFIRRFEKEAQLIAGLEHLHITPLYDYWRDQSGAYLVMRYLRGGNLRNALAKESLALSQIAHIINQVAVALQYAHDKGIIHRDIKPENILLDEEGNAYLADFGIAKNLTQKDAPMTEPGAVVGSLDYLSPEQARGEPVTPRTDIYSLAVVAYEMLTGEHPFQEFSSVERLYKHINDPLPLIDSLADDIGGDVNDVIQKATAKNPANRYPQVSAFAEALRNSLQLDIPDDTLQLEEVLTLREQEVLNCLAQGMNNREIADKLYITVGTVKWYNKVIFRKLDVRSRVQAVVKARELDLILREGEQPVENKAITSLSTFLDDLDNPYQGLHAFQPDDADLFFGREAITHKLLEKMQETGKFNRFVAVVGPSGSGKSSLVRAGVIPALWRGEIEGSENWFIVDMIPGTAPLDSLEVTLTRIVSERGINLHEQLARDERGLLRVADMLLPDDSSELVLVIDQFEEVFSLLEDETARQHFLSLLVAAVTDPHSRVRVIITLRADFYDRPLHYPAFGAILRERMETILPLTAEELTRAITEPAKLVKVTFEEGLVTQIVSDVNYQSGALPLLQYALTELFERRSGRVMTWEAYRAIGGAVGALAYRADELYHELSDAAQSIVHQLFLRLVTLGEGTEDTRRRVAREELLSLFDDDLTDEIIDLFANYRLLALDHDEKTRKPTVEVAHEAIIREWERLRSWLNDSRNDIRQQRRLGQSATEWFTHGKDVSYLMRGARLEQVERWLPLAQIVLTPLERHYIDASLAERQRAQAEEQERQAREAKLERRSRTVLRALVAVFAVAALISGGFGIFAVQQANEATLARDDAQAAELEARRQAGILLASAAQNEADAGFTDRAILLALEALENYPYSPQAERALGEAVTYNRALGQYLGHNSSATGADWSPDGARIATISTDNTVHIWDAETQQTGRIIELPTGISGNLNDWGLAVRWSPDGSRLYTLTGDRFLLGSQDFDLIVWDANTGEQLQIVELENAMPPTAGEGVNTSLENWLTGWGIDLHSDGRLATIAGNNTAIIWSPDMEPLQTLVGHELAVNGVMWSPDGSELLTFSDDMTVRIWDPETGEQLRLLNGHQSPLNAAQWSPDGSKIATTGDDGTLNIWDTNTFQNIQSIDTGSNIAWSLAWSEDGSLIVVGTHDGLVHIWNAQTGDSIDQLPGHNTFVTHLAPSPNNPDQMLSTSLDGRARLWNTSLSTAYYSFPEAYYGALDFAWTQDDSVLVGAQGDWFGGITPPITTVTDMLSRETISVFVSDESAFASQYGYFVDFTNDEQAIVTTNELVWPPSQWPDSNTPNLEWVNPNTGDLIQELIVPTNPNNFIRNFSLSPDESRVVLAMFNGEVYVLSTQTGEILQSTTCGNSAFGSGWSPTEDKYFVVCSQDLADSWVQIHDANAGEVLITLGDRSTNQIFTQAHWSPDGTRILGIGGNQELGVAINPIIVWDATTGEELLNISQHTEQIWDASWSPDGSRFATGSSDDTTRIWNAETGEELLRLDTPVDWSNYPVWSPTGEYLAVALYSVDHPSRSQVFRVWQSTQELIDYAYDCCVFRELTRDERIQFGLPVEE